MTLTTPATCVTPLTAPGLDDDDAAALAGLFGTLADPARIKILNHLATTFPEGVCVGDLLGPLELTQPSVSYHLKVLLHSALVRRERRGQFSVYSLRADALGRLAMLVGQPGTP